MKLVSTIVISEVAAVAVVAVVTVVAVVERGAPLEVTTAGSDVSG
jgi:hypothetical protein